MDQKEKYVVLLVNSARKAQVVGNANGDAFRSQSAAEKLARNYRECYPALDVLTMPVSRLGITTAPLGIRARVSRAGN